jgi:putative ABC transport system substrate-binding protein
MKRAAVRSVAVAVMLLTVAVIVEAQQAKKVPRIGFLGGNSFSDLSPRVDGFKQGLRELGYVEGQNINIEYRFADGKVERLSDLAAELTRLKLDCIVTAGTPATHAAKQATSTIPIVMGNVDDPIAQGFAISLARPGGNITGMTDIASELAGKRLELLKEAVPKLSRVAVLWTPNPPGSPQWEESRKTGLELGLQVHSMEVRNATDLENAFSEGIKARSAGLTVVAAPLLGANQKRIADLAIKHRLPVMWPFRQYVEAGGLMAYGPFMPDLYRRAATLVDKILKGAKPADLPIERPIKFELIINLNNAKQIGLTMPPNVLARADRVIR